MDQNPELQLDALDWMREGGTLVFHVFGALARFKRNLTREQTMAGLAAARAERRAAEGMLRDTRGAIPSSAT